MGVAATLDCPTVSAVAGGPPLDQERGDQLLVARLAAGDQHALEMAYDRHRTMVHGIARRVAADEEIAGEVTQDVFVHLWEAPHRVDLTRGSLRSYLGVLAHRRAVDAVRRAARRERAEQAASTTLPHAPQRTFDEEIAEVDALLWCSGRLLEALDDLPSEQREVVRLTYFEGRTFKEVAELLGIPEGTAKSRVRLAIGRVRAATADDLSGER